MTTNLLISNVRMHPIAITPLIAVVAASLAGCGNGGSSEPSAPSSSPALVSPAQQQLPAQPTVESEAVSEPTAEPQPSDAYTPQPPSASEPEASSEPDLAEPESDAERWVDRRQNDVLPDVNENNMDAIEAWTP